MSFTKKIVVIVLALSSLGLASAFALYAFLGSQLPPLFSVEDYKPLLVSEVYARNGEKIGEFYRENRKLLPIEEVPEDLINAFLAAEDSDFYEHNGFNYKGIFRAVVANLTSGDRTQGASTITQQAARTLFLSSEKTYTRKLKEAILARRMENYLSKKEILYLYLNQIYFGQGAHGVLSAADTFFRKKPKELTIAEMAALAGSLTAPSAYNLVANPKRAKVRQQYVLKRMLETERISEAQYEQAMNETLTVYRKKKYKEVAPYFVETIRQLLVKELGEGMVLDQGLKIYSSLDFTAQKQAQLALRKGLRELDKRQGYRGPKGTVDIKDERALTAQLLKERNRLVDDFFATYQVFPDGSSDEYGEFKPFQAENRQDQNPSNLPEYMKIGDTIEAVVTQVDDKNKLVYVRMAETQGILPLERMAWAREPDPSKAYSDYLHIKKPSQALKPGDIIDVEIIAATAVAIPDRPGVRSIFRDYAEVALDQEPAVEGALLSFDLKTDDIIAMVGGSDFRKTKLNRTYQAVRQTGSAFKPILYAAGLEKGLTPATPIMGAPIVYNQETGDDKKNQNDEEDLGDTEEEEESKVWKPGNYGGKFTGDILVRNALKKSLNTPTIRILEKTGVAFSAEYARRLGIFSPMSLDMSLALGSSGATLYEMTKAYSIFARLGKGIQPILIHEIRDHSGTTIAQNVSFDLHFKDRIGALKEEFTKKREEFEARIMKTNDEEEKVSPFFFNDPNQLISPQTAFLTTTLLQAVVNESGGTGVRAKQLNRDVAAKTGTTNGYYDAWFMGYKPEVASGVWVGFDQEKTLGKGESGARAALPIWLEFMKVAVAETKPRSFPVPNNIVFANIDNETGRLATARSHEVVRQAFVQGTEPGLQTEQEDKQQEEEDKTDFLREDF